MVSIIPCSIILRHGMSLSVHSSAIFSIDQAIMTHTRISHHWIRWNTYESAQWLESMAIFNRELLQLRIEAKISMMSLPLQNVYYRSNLGKILRFTIRSSRTSRWYNFLMSMSRCLGQNKSYAILITTGSIAHHCLVALSTLRIIKTLKTYIHLSNNLLDRLPILAWFKYLRKH